MKEHLQIWYDAWLAEHKETRLIWASPGQPHLNQVHFIRDVLAPLVFTGVKYENMPKLPEPRSDIRETAFVIGEHRSKSVRLPVYLFERSRLGFGLQLVLQYNFYDWDISIRSDRAIPVQILDDIDPLNTQCFFEGFPPGWRLGPFIDDPRAFSVSVYSDYDAYAFVKRLVSWRLDLDRKKPTFNHTRGDALYDACPECAALLTPYEKALVERDRERDRKAKRKAEMDMWEAHDAPLLAPEPRHK